MSASHHLLATDLPVALALFDTAFPSGHAFGRAEVTTWRGFAGCLSERREGSKDGPSFIPATFIAEPDGRVRRLNQHVIARTAIALDVETNKQTGEVPPAFDEAVAHIENSGWAAAVYTSHFHTETAPRYRIVFPISAEIAPTLPAVEAVATYLGFDGVLDRSKVGAASLFYLPSADPGCIGKHQATVIDGDPIPVTWLQHRVGALLAAREAEQAQQRAEALEAAERRGADRIKAGFIATDSIIEKVRNHLNLEIELLNHGYQQHGKRYLYPGSKTGVPGVHVMRGSDGVERVYSHHAADPLAAGNLPSWCHAKAIDVVDVIAILEHGGNLSAALRTMAQRFGIETPRQSTSLPEPPPHPGYDRPEACDETAVHSEAAPAVNKPAVTPAGLIFTNPTSLFGEPIPERHWIVDGWLPIGHVTLLYGDGGVGKTLLAQQLMSSCATGTPWCGLYVEPCRVLGVFCEDDGDELHRRQDAINEGTKVYDEHGRVRCLNFADLGNMRWISRVGADNLLVTFDHDNRVQLTPLLAEIEAAAKAFGAKLVVIDTAADTFGGNENDRGQVRQFIGHALNKLAQSTGAAVLLNAHPSRSGMSQTGDLDGGSTGWSNSARSRWALTRLTGEDVPKDTPERVLSRRKANYAVKGTEIKLKWHAGVLQPAERPSASISAGSNDARAEMVFLDLLDRCDEQEVRVSNSKNAGNFGPKVFAKRPDAEGFSAKDFDKAMARLFTKQLIRMEDYGRAGDARQRIIRSPKMEVDAP